MIKVIYCGCRFPPEIIQHAIWLYVRFTLSFRDVEDLPASAESVAASSTLWISSCFIIDEYLRHDVRSADPTMKQREMAAGFDQQISAVSGDHISVTIFGLRNRCQHRGRRL